ncbi:MAG: PD40 domain-containing protein [Saprospiraceae bacterium]|nr:PD40 domain-containing protein [Saprospiraceae bacterium]MBK8669154.1 PD40 domain-containing protein [Saprospiraceae bacterium]
MKFKYGMVVVVMYLVLASCQTSKTGLLYLTLPAEADTLRYPAEKHLKNVRQLTFGGDNAEAYWSFDNKKVVFQATNKMWGAQCDQIYYFDLTTLQRKAAPPPLLSTGKGRTTCSFFMPGNKSIVYASTHEANASCPHVPERRADGKYIWPIYETFDIYHGDLEGNIIKKLTDSPGYDAEATVSPKGDKIVFTSTRSGDLELYTMNVDGSDVRQVTRELGYDGGAFFSPDGTKLIFRASRPKTEEDVRVYKELLAQNQVMPTSMELYVCNVDGTDLRQLTQLGKANWAPYFLPKGNKVIFSSNHAAPRGYQFNLYTINLDGTGLEQITFDKTFDSFPMFSYDGKKIIFASNRNNGGTRDTNLFIADWVD